MQPKKIWGSLFACRCGSVRITLLIKTIYDPLKKGGQKKFKLITGKRGSMLIDEILLLELLQEH
jgi:hypothetical protein